MKVFSIVVLVLVVLVAPFAVFNREPVTVDLFPVLVAVEIPLYLAVLAAVFVGFVAGWLASWIVQGKWRQRARERARRIAHLERELSELSARADEPPARGGAPVAVKGPAPPLATGTDGPA